MTREGERGFTLVETMVGLFLIALVAFGLIVVFRGMTKNAEASVINQHTSVVLAQFMDTIESDAHSSIAVFVPATDVKGVSNADGHEVDFYTMDGYKNPYFWAYNFSSSTHSIQKYNYTWGDAGSVTAVGQPYVLSTGTSTVGAFTAAFEDAASRASSPMFASYTPVDHSLQTGYPGVVAGNNLVQITVTAQAANSTMSEQRETRLMAGTQLSGGRYLLGTFTPPPNPLGVTINPISFASQASAGTTTVATENYYVGTYSYSPGTCTGAIVTIAQSGTGFTVTPNAGISSTQNCTFIVSDQLGQSVSVPVTVTYSLTPMVVNPTTLLYMSAGAAAQNFNVSEAGYSGSFTITSPANCVALGIASIDSFSRTGPSTSFSVTPTGAGGGACSFTVSDSHGSSQAVAVTVYGPLSLSPGALSFASKTAAAQSFTASEKEYTGAITVASTTCAATGVATIDATSLNGPSAAFTVTPKGSGSCTYTMADNHGGAATETITVAAAAATPTPSPTPKPTPTPIVGAPTPKPSPSLGPVVINFAEGTTGQPGGRVSNLWVTAYEDTGNCVCNVWPAGYGYMYVDARGNPLPKTGKTPMQMAAAVSIEPGELPPSNWAGSSTTWAGKCGAELLTEEWQFAQSSWYGVLAYVEPALPSSPYYNGPSTSVPITAAPACGASL